MELPHTGHLMAPPLDCNIICKPNPNKGDQPSSTENNCSTQRTYRWNLWDELKEHLLSDKTLQLSAQCAQYFTICFSCLCWCCNNTQCCLCLRWKLVGRWRQVCGCLRPRLWQRCAVLCVGFAIVAVFSCGGFAGLDRRRWKWTLILNLWIYFDKLQSIRKCPQC